MSGILCDADEARNSKTPVYLSWIAAAIAAGTLWMMLTAARADQLTRTAASPSPDATRGPLIERMTGDGAADACGLLEAALRHQAAVSVWRTQARSGDRELIRNAVAAAGILLGEAGVDERCSPAAAPDGGRNADNSAR